MAVITSNWQIEEYPCHLNGMPCKESFLLEQHNNQLYSHPVEDPQQKRPYLQWDCDKESDDKSIYELKLSLVEMLKSDSWWTYPSMAYLNIYGTTGLDKIIKRPAMLTGSSSYSPRPHFHGKIFKKKKTTSYFSGNHKLTRAQMKVRIK